MNNFQSIVSHFKIEGKIQEISPLGSGLINDTYRIRMRDADAPGYVLQRINHDVFQNVEMLQANIEAVTTHIRKKLIEQGADDLDRKVLSLIRTETGKSYWNDGQDYWRIMLFIPRAKTYETVNPEYSYYAGRAFGNFQAMLADIPETIGETIPNFHNMRFRLEQLNDAVSKDVANRVKEVKYYLSEIGNRAEDMCKGEQLHQEGLLPKRVCHCDTKVNNILFDEKGQVLCVIDLDTVMPNYIFSDFGDFLRSAANTGAEDDENLDNVNFNMEIFGSFTKGYLEAARGFLLPVEIENLSYAAILFPYMQCVRFLTDFINGDIYYKIKYPEHNLVRVKAQFKLLQSAERHIPEMKKIINLYL